MNGPVPPQKSPDLCAAMSGATPFCRGILDRQ